jgi:hypothetical protein
MKDAIKAAVLADLKRQALEDRHGAPWIDNTFDPATDRTLMIDGHVDLDALAEAVDRAVKAEVRERILKGPL